MKIRMVREIMKSLRQPMKMILVNRKETEALLCTLVVSIAFLLMFLNFQANFVVLNLSASQEIFIKSLMMVAFTGLIAFVCILNCFMANSYFLKAKSKEFCIYLSSGMNILGLMKYLFIQNGFIMLLSITLGSILGFVLNPIFNFLVMKLSGVTIPLFSIDIQGIGFCFIILIYEYFFMCLFNVGYAYRCELKDLLDEDKKLNLGDSRMIKLPHWIYYFCYVLGLSLLLMFDVHIFLYVFVSLLGFFAIQGVLRHIVSEKISQRKFSHKNLRAINIIVQGNLYASLKAVLSYVLLILAIFFFACNLLSVITQDVYAFAYVCLGYLLMMVMMCMSLYFKFLLEAKRQKSQFQHLRLIGFVDQDLRLFIKTQFQMMFGCMMLVPLPYGIIMCIKQDSLNASMYLVLFTSYLVILALTYHVSLRALIKILLNKEGDRDGKGY